MIGLEQSSKIIKKKRCAARVTRLKSKRRFLIRDIYFYRARPARAKDTIEAIHTPRVAQMPHQGGGKKKGSRICLRYGSFVGAK